MTYLWGFCKSARIPCVQLHTTGVLLRASKENLNQVKTEVGIQKKNPDNEAKEDTPKTEMRDFVNKAKRDVWKSQNTLSQMSTKGSEKVFRTLLVTTGNGITTIQLNRPQKKNAISVEMYSEIKEALDLAGNDDSVITVMTGSGGYYCSGNDLNNFSKARECGFEKTAEELKELLRNYVKAYIDFPKPLIAVVNGPAVGVSVTALSLFDIVYATESATFQTHFTQQGQSPSCCSSYTFPKMMGATKANEMLLFNKKLTATQACRLGLVTEVFPDSSFQSEVWTRLKAYTKLPPNSLALSKQLIRQMEKDKLHAVNDAEVDRLKERWLSDECLQAVMSFFKAKAKQQS